MTNIIAQIAEKVVDEILKILAEKGISNIEKAAEELLSVLKDGTLNILSAAIEELDETIWHAKGERRDDGLTVKARKVERTYLTGLGELKYRRTYYQCKDGEMLYLVDHLIGVEGYARVSKELCAKLVENAACMSMQKAAKAENVPVSRQTVNNKVLAMKEAAATAERIEETPPELHLFADEDHVHLRPKGVAYVPLVTVTEGIDTTNPKRHSTVRPLHFQGCGVVNSRFAEDVVSAIYERYDMDKVRTVYIHGDGGNWIRKIGDLLPNPVYVMDGFHLEKYYKKFCRLNGAQPYAGVLRHAILMNDFDSFAKYCIAIRNKQDEAGEKKMAELVTYFQNNWESIVERASGHHCGSCTEPLISHVLSERMSRTPLAWSREGLAKMAMLRVYTQNGGTVTADHIRVSRSKEERRKDYRSLKNGFSVYNKYAEKQAQTIFNTPHDWSIFEREHILPGLTDGRSVGTTTILNAYSHLCSELVS
jgi:hypothetical protein